MWYARSALFLLALCAASLFAGAVARTGRLDECLYQISAQRNTPNRCGKEVTVVEHEYCVVGAGPSGLQTALFLQQAGRDYVVLERNATAGAFFQRYPRHRRLISINKPFTGTPDNAENNLRHDWHSLLTTPSPSVNAHGERVDASEFTYTGGNYSVEYFPHADTLVQYIQDYARHYSINVRYAHRVESVYRWNAGPAHKLRDKPATEIPAFRVEVTVGEQTPGAKVEDVLYECKYVIMAAGYHVPRVHEMADQSHELMEGYETCSTSAADYAGENVLVVGAGNAAMEIANSVSTRSAHVHLMHRSRLRFAWETHYVGDIRAVNAKFLDQYQLKSLDGILNGDLGSMRIVRDATLRNPYTNRSQFRLEAVERSVDADAPNSPFREGYDRIIRATGFWWDGARWPCHVFATAHAPQSSDPSYTEFMRQKSECTKLYGAAPLVDKKHKFAVMTSQYESINVPNLYFVGALSHGRDFRQSSGGFVHGFRYTVRTLFHVLQERNHGVAWPAVVFRSTGGGDNALERALRHMTRRMNEASGLYQMFGLCADVLVVHEDATTGAAELRYYEDYHMDRLLRLPEAVAAVRAGRALPRIVTMTYEYHPEFKGAKVFDLQRAVSDPRDAHLSNFLHPIVRLWLPYDDSSQNSVWSASKVSTQAKVPELQAEPLSRYPFTFAGLRKAGEHHVIEDFLLKFDSDVVHAEPLRWFVRECFAKYEAVLSSQAQPAATGKSEL